MASRLLRRSGYAFGLVAEALNWRADMIYQVGVGGYHEECDVFMEEWPGVQFIGCEPFPMRAEEYKGLLLRVAVSDYVGEAPFYLKRRHHEGSTLHKLPDDKTIKVITVPVSTLDVLFPHPEGEHVLLWLDCEGSELAALRGGEEFVKRVEMINVEMTALPDGEHWVSPKLIHEWLLAHGFRRQWVHTFRVPAAQYDSIYVRNELFDPRRCCDPQDCV